MVKVKETLTEKEAIEVMQDDLLSLTAEIDCLLDLFRALKAGKMLPMAMVDEMLSSAENTSCEVFDRWEDMEFGYEE